MVRGEVARAHSALKGYPKAALCATSKLCQYSSGTNAVWHNRTLKHRTRRDIGRTAHSYFRPTGRADILPLCLDTFSQQSDRHVASSCAIGPGNFGLLKSVGVPAGYGYVADSVGSRVWA